MAEAGPGKIRLFNEFVGPQQLDSLTATSHYIGPFRACGEGFADSDAGFQDQETGGNLSGTLRIESANTDQDSSGLVTSKMFDVALMAPIVMEARLQFNNLDTKEFFFGLSDVNEDDVALETDIIGGGTETLTLTASDIVGFYLDSELTEDEMWHGVYNGGTTAGATDSTTVELVKDAVAAEFDIIRLEIDPSGDARWFLNNILRQSVSKAVSTSTDLAMNLLVGTKGSTFEEVDVEYVLVTANRDWTV